MLLEVGQQVSLFRCTTAVAVEQLALFALVLALRCATHTKGPASDWDIKREATEVSFVPVDNA